MRAQDRANSLFEFAPESLIFPYTNPVGYHHPLLASLPDLQRAVEEAKVLLATLHEGKGVV